MGCFQPVKEYGRDAEAGHAKGTSDRRLWLRAPQQPCQAFLGTTLESKVFPPLLSFFFAALRLTFPFFFIWNPTYIAIRSLT